MTSMRNFRKKLLIDTDLGSDIDDAVALWWLLHQDVDILGITTCTGEPEKRAAGVHAILREAQRLDIPIGIGNPSPLSAGPQLQPKAQLLEDIEPFPHQIPAGRILEKVWEEPAKTVHLLAIGPLTNLANLELRRPGSLERFQSICIMGGVFSPQVIPSLYPWVRSDTDKEWNFLCDPDAVKVVFQRKHNIALVPLDATQFMGFHEGEWQRWVQSLPKTIQLQSQKHALPNNKKVVHDWLAALAAIEPENPHFEWFECSLVADCGRSLLLPGEVHRILRLNNPGRLRDRFRNEKSPGRIHDGWPGRDVA